jgi:hypothetical protein
MADNRIKISKGRILRRKLLDGSRSIIPRFRAWLKELLQTWRASKPYKIPSITDGGSKLPEGTNNSVIRIQPGARRTAEAVTRPGADLRNTATTNQRSRTPRANERLNRICPACYSEITAGDRRATCRVNREHVIHARCVKLVKNKCPTCKGYIAAAPAGRSTVLVSSESENHVCLACTAEIMADDPTAKCRSNPEHVIHARCVSLVKSQCPTCKGRIR